MAAGRLKVLGITQEQHPARCRLFAQWHGIDWPILWDPFNLTGSKAVPRFRLVDEHGVVRVPRARPSDLDAFLAASFEAPSDPPAAAPADARLVARGLDTASAEGRALEALLYDGAGTCDASIATLRGLPPAAAEAARTFRLGVAHRMRYDGPSSKPVDFADALAHWTSALLQRPDQYIWRRRIQQYGPRPDKPYPFYDWVERARRDVAARGEAPVILPVPLTETERNVWRKATEDETEPDPQDRVPSVDDAPVVRIEEAVAWSTARGKPAARVHLRVVLVDPERASFNASEEVVGWIRTPRGAGWQAAPRRLAGAIAQGARDDRAAVEPVPLEFELTPSEPAGTVDPYLLEGYLLLPICVAEDGRCLVVRQAFAVTIRQPDR